MPQRKKTLAERGVPLPRDWVLPPMPSERGLLSAVVTQMFDDLGVSVAFWLYDVWWQPIHISLPSLVNLEQEFGFDVPRREYNWECLQRAVRQGQPVVGELRGTCDLFIPAAYGGKREGALVVGSFMRTRPSSAEIRERWFDMSGSRPRLSDPAFYRYVSLTLATLTLEGPLESSFLRLMNCFAMLVSGKGDPETLGVDAQKCRQELLAARLPERMWGTVRRLVDEQSMESTGNVDHGVLASLGVERVPQSVAVGLLAGERALDPLDERVAMNGFLRACVGLARKQGGTLVGPVGNNGVVLLTDSKNRRGGSALVDLTERARALAKEYALELRAGIVEQSGVEPLPTRYLAALRAAEKATSEGKSMLRGERATLPTAAQLRRLRGELGRSVERGPNFIAERFEEYVQAVLVNTGYRVEEVRSHLEAGIERLVEPIAAEGLLDDKNLSDLWTSIERAADGARTVLALADAYRRIVGDLARGIQNPAGARHERSMRRALAFMREHLEESLPLDRVARAAGFAPKYFSRLFHESENVSYADYLRDLRLARAKELLKISRFTVDRVARSCGFQTRTYFHRVFQRAVGATPIEYRMLEERKFSRSRA